MGPGTTWPVARFEDQKTQPNLLQVITGNQAGLAGPDHNGIVNHNTGLFDGLFSDTVSAFVYNVEVIILISSISGER